MEFEQDEEQSRSDSSGTSKAQMHERESEFGDQNCGEPLLAQRLLIDFTIDDELDLDSEYNQKKCRAFWDFIKSKPELQYLMAIPEVADYGESFMSSSEYQQSESRLVTPEPVVRSAVSTIELVQHKDQMAPALLGKLAQSHCSHGSREYKEPVVAIKKANQKGHVCSCKGSCDRCRRNMERSRARVKSNALAVDLCKKIKKWDAEHPKSMVPPANISALQKKKFY